VAEQPVNSDTMACPGCQATLRVPPTAAAIRCPACKTVITIQQKPAPPSSIPLTFDAPTTPVAAAPTVAPVAIARSVPMAKAAPVGNRVRAVEVQDDDPDDEKPVEDKPRKKKQSLLDYDDSELSDKELREKRRLEELYEQSKPANTGTKLLSYACLVECLALLFGFLYMAVATFRVPLVPIAWVAILLHIIALIMEITSMGLCIKGPKMQRSMAVWGVIVSTLALLSLCIAFFYSLAGHAVAFAGDSDVYGKNAGASIWVLAPLAPTLEFMNIIYWISDGTLTVAVVPWFMIFPGLLELARHSYSAVLMRSYCEEGKAPELGFKVSRFMFRLYLAYLAFFIFRVIACALIVLNACQKEDQALLIFLGLSYAGTLAVLSVIFLAQFYALKDTADVVDYKRFAMKIKRLEVD
jgi:LSD1 subclass zinc finger protein